MGYMATHDTLDAALRHILSDTYGHNNVERETDDNGEPTGRYVTSVDATGTMSDTVMWTYDGGLESPGGDDHTRLMDPYETICEPDHLRWHFPQVEEFERGEHSALTFAFVLVDSYPGDDDDLDMFDPTVGYIYELYVY